MIVAGTSLERGYRVPPAEVIEWLEERNTLYPGIKFKVDYQLAEKYPKGEWEKVKNYSRSYHGKQGIMVVTFIFETEIWAVRIVGGVDKEGTIVNYEDPEYLSKVKGPLSEEQRNSIAGFEQSEQMQQVEEYTWALLK